MSNSLFSDAAKQQLTELKKQLKPQRVDEKNHNSKPEQSVSLPSKALIQKQLKKINAQKKELEQQLSETSISKLTTQKTKAQSHEAVQSTQLTDHDLSENSVTEDDLLFKQAMFGTTPLKGKNQIRPETLRQQTTKDKKTLAKRAAATGADESTHTPLSDTQAFLNPVSEDAFLMYKESTLPNNIFAKLKAGKLRWFDAVDIHGADVEQARAAVLKIIEITQENQESVLKIVHGKGKDAILKTCVNSWLRQHEDVMAFSSALPKDGGTGAVLVLLKRRQLA